MSTGNDDIKLKKELNELKEDKEHKEHKENTENLALYVESGNLNKVRELLKLGANPNCKCKVNSDSIYSDELESIETFPLMIAVEGMNDEMVETLLKAGADPNLKSHVNEIARSSASSDAPLSPLMVVVCALEFPGVSSEWLQRKTKIIKLLLDAGTKLNETYDARGKKITVLDFMLSKREKNFSNEPEWKKLIYGRIAQDILEKEKIEEGLKKGGYSAIARPSAEWENIAEMCETSLKENIERASQEKSERTRPKPH